MRKMMVLLFILHIVLVHLSCQNSLVIENKGFTGYIFSKEHFVFKNVESEKARYTPTKEDIYLAEYILNENKSFLKQNQKMQKCCPVISENLENYARQYVGFVNTNDEKILWVNFVWKGYVADLIEKDIIDAYDGGSFFWSIFINLSEKTLFCMEVNGVS
jgi:hypothetical protein